jgi:cell division protease FtsH
VFTLAATNHSDRLDPALLRPGRFDEVIPIDLPGLEARKQFFQVRLAKLKTAVTLDADAMARRTPGCTPADLDRMLREAVYKAVEGGRRQITPDDFEHARKLVRFGARKEDIVLHEQERRATAHHEAGHAVVHMALFPEQPIDYLTIVPTESGALGFMASLGDESRHSRSGRDVEHELAVLVAGREAELAAAGDSRGVSSGAASDLERATRLAYLAVGMWGLDENFGPVSLAGLPAATRASVDVQVAARTREWLSRAQVLAKRVMDERRDRMNSLVAQLLERESVDGTDLGE